MTEQENIAIKSFHDGCCEYAQELLGVHRIQTGFVFRVWAPRAKEVFVVGDFNNWTPVNPMIRISDGGVWEADLPAESIRAGQKYKYQIFSEQGVYYKSDPYGVRFEHGSSRATVVEDIVDYTWRDSGWLSYRKRCGSDWIRNPINVYYLHLTSWKKREDGTPYHFRDLSTELSSYVKQMGFTHIGLALDDCTPYFSLFPPFERPIELMAFVDSMHEAGIGVILDWNPTYFKADEPGLAQFDGSSVYEYSEKKRQCLDVDSARRFDLGRGEVISFLLSGAIQWVEKYHIDGLCVRFVSRAICLGCNKTDGDWTPDVSDNNRCLEAIRFFKLLKQSIKAHHPDAMIISDESSPWQGVTDFFDLKWNTEWARDAISYCEMDPIYRKYHHEKMTHVYAEQNILPLFCVDDAIKRDGLSQRMFGDYWQKFATHRALLGFMITHPGKKLSFMGDEIGQFWGWNSEEQVLWHLLDQESHAKFQHYVSELNHLYLQHPPLWELDDSRQDFHWIDVENREQSVLSYYRSDRNGNNIVVVINFTPVTRNDFFLGVPQEGAYEEILNSDELRFGGSGITNPKEIFTAKKTWNHLPYTIQLTLPPLGITVLRYKG